jgi:putative transposase
VKFGFIAKHRGIWPIGWLCEALGVSRGGFYAWLRRPHSQRSRDNEELAAKVRASFLGSDRTYGARRVWRDMLAEGISCGLHRIERLMRLQALKARPRRRRLSPDLGERQAAAVAPNVLDRSFEAPAPNRIWIADFTYIWTAEGWLYVAAVIDLFSRRVVGWSMSAGMTAQLVTDALVMAIWRRGKPDALLHHSDRGSQYTSEQFLRLMADHGVICSMSRSGNVWDNAAMESFFSSLKTERTGRKLYRTRDDAKSDVFDYIALPHRRCAGYFGFAAPTELRALRRMPAARQPDQQRQGCRRTFRDCGWQRARYGAWPGRSEARAALPVGYAPPRRGASWRLCEAHRPRVRCPRGLRSH